MSDARRPPRLEWDAVLVGLALALVLGIGATAIGLGAFGQIAAVAAGGALAARRATGAPLFHGAVVGAGWILVFSAISGPTGSAGSIVADTVSTVVGDLFYMSAGAAGGWLAGRLR